MKRILLFLSMAMMMIVALTSAKNADILEFKERSYDFGTVAADGPAVVHEFEFTNVTDEPVAVLSVSTQCGCTRPEYPTEPIQPGKKAKIKVTFNPLGQDGEINKDVTVRYRGAKAKSSKRIKLRLHGRVK